MAAFVENYEDKKVLSQPLCLKGPVVHGFKRGSKELGIPTANLDADVLGDSLADFPTGVYLGWASVGTDPTVHKVVMSIGWNPFYKNEKKTIEPHLLASFQDDFYGQELRLVVTGYLRPEKNYPDLDTLIKAIRLDIDTAAADLELPEHGAARVSPFLAPPAAGEAAPASS